MEKKLGNAQGENDLEFQVLFLAKLSSKRLRTNKYILGMQRLKHVLKGIPSGGLTEGHKIKETVITKPVNLESSLSN